MWAQLNKCLFGGSGEEKRGALESLDRSEGRGHEGTTYLYLPQPSLFVDVHLVCLLKFHFAAHKSEFYEIETKLCVFVSASVEAGVIRHVRLCTEGGVSGWIWLCDGTRRSGLDRGDECTLVLHHAISITRFVTHILTTAVNPNHRLNTPLQSLLTRVY